MCSVFSALRRASDAEVGGKFLFFLVASEYKKYVPSMNTAARNVEPPAVTVVSIGGTLPLKTFAAVTRLW
jgi:hypothetical protein